MTPPPPKSSPTSPPGKIAGFRLRLPGSLDRPIAVAPGLTLSPMGCGTWAWGNRLLWGYSPAQDGELQQVFATCLGRGVTWFDTGDSYGTGRLRGRSEELLGRFAQDYRGKNRDRLVIATKLAAYPWRLNRQAMVRAGEASAQRLGRSIDLVQMHWSPANYAPWQEGALLDGLGDLYDRGLVKGVGLSNYGPVGVRRVQQRFRDRGVPLATLQVQVSLLTLGPALEELRATCQELGVQPIAYSPMALGLLTGKYSEGQSLPQGLRGALFRQLLPSLAPLLGVLREVARSRGKTCAQVALNWCRCQGMIPIPGAKTVAQAVENAGALGWRLSPGEVAALEQAAQRARPMVQNIFQTP